MFIIKPSILWILWIFFVKKFFRNPLALLDLALKATHDSRFMPIDLLRLWIGPGQGVDGMPHDYIFTVERY